MVALYFKIKAYLVFQEILVLRYYKNLHFALVDILLKAIYSVINPYRISKKFLKKNKYPNVHMYGETPIVLFDDLLKKCKLTANDTFLELGCGRGRLCYFVQSFYKCKVIGIEQVPTFVTILHFLQKVLRIKNMQIVKKDMLKMNYFEASFIFLYGTCLEYREIEAIIHGLQNTKKSVKILTIGVLLKDYDESFQTIESFPIKLPWGETKAYLQTKKSL